MSDMDEGDREGDTAHSGKRPDVGPVDVPQSKCQSPCCTNGGRDFVPMRINTYCPVCGLLHVDQGDWETKKHRIHRCVDWTETFVINDEQEGTSSASLELEFKEHKGCGFEWQPAHVFTVGVQEATT